jgi:hypothetical protein
MNLKKMSLFSERKNTTPHFLLSFSLSVSTESLIDKQLRSQLMSKFSTENRISAMYAYSDTKLMLKSQKRQGKYGIIKQKFIDCSDMTATQANINFMTQQQET